MGHSWAVICRLVHGGGSRRPFSSLVPFTRPKAWSREFLALTLVARRLAQRRDPVLGD
jgi:hypothetical protein